MSLHKDVVKAGEQIASDLIDAQVSKAMGTMGGHDVKDISEYPNSDLIQKYLDEEISSVEAIHIAMKRAEEIMIRVGKHTVSEEELNKRIINKIPKSQFARIIKSIETDLDKKI